MGRGREVRAIVLAVAVVGLLLPTVATAGGPTVVRHPVYGGAEAYFGTCTEDVVTPTPPAGTVCTDNYVIVWQGAVVVGGGPVPASDPPWSIYIETDRVEFVGTDEPVVTIIRQGGGLLDGVASSDRQHLATATVSATIPMTDGTTYAFAASWQAWSDRLVFGNNGPATGRPHHYVDKCLTVVANGHQKFRFAHMAGTLNGAAVQSYDDFDFAATIFNNDFQYIEVPHGGCK